MGEYAYRQQMILINGHGPQNKLDPGQIPTQFNDESDYTRLMHPVTESIAFQHKKDCALQHAHFILTPLTCTTNIYVKA